MNATILLKEYLTKERLEEAWREIERYGGIAVEVGEMLDLCLVVDSNGGDTSATLNFTERIAASRGMFFQAKIYRAESAAAFIALRLHNREMVKGGTFTIGLGSAEIDSGVLITEEKVPAHIVEEAKRWRKTVFSLLAKCGFPEKGERMEKLIAQNWLTLTAEECLASGLVHRII